MNAKILYYENHKTGTAELQLSGSCFFLISHIASHMYDTLSLFNSLSLRFVGIYIFLASKYPKFYLFLEQNTSFGYIE